MELDHAQLSLTNLLKQIDKHLLGQNYHLPNNHNQIQPNNYRYILKDDQFLHKLWFFHHLLTVHQRKLHKHHVIQSSNTPTTPILSHGPSQMVELNPA
ncbi:hypothetical protein D3C76_1403160 [compost metagenome]